MHTNAIVVSAVYKAAVDDISKGLNNWVGNVISLLEEFGFAHVLLNPDCVNQQKFPNVFKHGLWTVLCKNGIIVIYKNMEFYINFSKSTFHMNLTLTFVLALS